jgi:uncharacterized protein YqeY
MSLENKINEDLKIAMKDKDAVRLRGIRAIKSAILLLKTDGSGKVIDEDAEIKLLQKLVKQRKDSLDIYKKQGRDDLAKTEQEEIDVIGAYLPKQLSVDEIREVVRELIKKSGASSVKDMGKVMGMASKEFAGKADGATIAGIVKELLANG